MLCITLSLPFVIKNVLKTFFSVEQGRHFQGVQMTSAIVLFVEQFSFDRRKTKTKVNQRKFKLKTGEKLKARKNASDQVAIGVNFASDCFKG